MAPVHDPLGNAADFAWPEGDRRGSLEVWYGLCGPADGRFAFWFRYTLLATRRGDREGRLWAALTDREAPERSFFASRRVAADAVRLEESPFAYRLCDGSAELRDDGARGTMEVPGLGALRWSLTYEPDPFTFTLLRSPFLTNLMAARGSTRHRSVNQAVRVRGEVELGDRRLVLDDAPGHQGHTASRRLVRGWAWMQCSAFDDGACSLEALSLGPLTTVCLRTEAGIFRLNRLRDLVGPGATRATVSPGHFCFSGRGEGVTLEAEVSAPEDVPWQRVAYRAPDETLRYNAHCSLAEVRLRYRLRGEAVWREASSPAGRAEWVASRPPIPGRYLPAEWSEPICGGPHG